MTTQDLMTLAPLLPLAAAPLLVLAIVALRRHHAATVLAMTACLMTSAVLVVGAPPTAAPPLLAIDALGRALLLVILGAALVCSWLFWVHLRRGQDRPEEAQALLAVATLGGAVTVLAQHVASIFLGIATLSVALYGLIAYPRDRRAIEAGLKYLILAAASSALFLFGAAVLYADTGTLRLSELAVTPFGELAVVGTALMLVAVAFKLALVPFHHWAPDVYQGAPVPTAAAVASLSKVAVLGLALRLSIAMASSDAFATGLAAIGGASILVGNLMALRQTDLRRLLGYSSIAHLGYASIALVAGGSGAVLVYAAGYAASVLTSFSAITLRADEGYAIDDCAGLIWRRPLVGTALAVSMLSLAGIPLTAGFMAKLYVVTAGAETDQWLTLGLLVVGSAMGVVYYLRVVARCLAPVPEGAPAGLPDRSAGATLVGQGVLVVLLAAVIVLGLSPSSAIPGSDSAEARRDVATARPLSFPVATEASP